MKLKELQDSIARTELRVAQGRARSALLYQGMRRSLRSRMRLPGILLAVFAGAAVFGYVKRQRRRAIIIERRAAPRELSAEQSRPRLMLTLWAVIGFIRQIWKFMEPVLQAIEARSRYTRDTPDEARDRSGRPGSRK